MGDQTKVHQVQVQGQVLGYDFCVTVNNWPRPEPQSMTPAYGAMPADMPSPARDEVTGFEAAPQKDRPVLRKLWENKEEIAAILLRLFGISAAVEPGRNQQNKPF
jgi:hypothetical protein